MANYADALIKAVRYGRAPIDDMLSIVKAGVEDGLVEPNNTPDAVLADFLAEHDDPREDIVRRDLAIRKRGEFGWIAKQEADEHERVGNSLYGRTVIHPLLDGGSLQVTALHRDGRIVGHKIGWEPSNDLQHYFLGHYTADESAALFDKLGIQHPPQ